MKYLFYTVLLIVTPQLLFAQHTILWKVTDTTNHTLSYIVGTYHQMGNSFVDLYPQIKEALLHSDLAVFESIDDVQKTRDMIQEREPSNDIEKYLHKRDLAKLKEISKDWKVDLYKLKPLEIRWKLEQEYQYVQCHTAQPTDSFDTFDGYLQHIAETNNIPLKGLETSDLQLQLLNQEFHTPSWKDEKRVIKAWIHQITAKNPNPQLCELSNKYRQFAIDYHFDEPCDTNVVILQRNNQWMTEIPQLLHQQNTFIAVGIYHLRKQCGLLQQLKDSGFLVEPVTLVSKNQK